jgi:uncharacterized protein (TIGR02466 family)
MKTPTDRNRGSFGTPIIVFENTELIDKLKDYILSQATDGIASKVAEDIKVNLTESKFDLFQRKVEIIEKTTRFIASSLKKTLNSLQQENYGYKISFNESWYHIGEKNSAHESHSHPNCSWCGVFCVQSGDPNSGGETVFQSPIRSNFSDHGTKYWDKVKTLRVKAKDGRLILFPSHLTHSQSLYTGDKPRIVVAFNSTIFGIEP